MTPTPWRRASRTALRLAFSHHPLCGFFREDVFEVRGLRICAGCALAIPSFLLGALAAVVLFRHGFGAWALGGAGALLGIPQLLAYRLRYLLVRRPAKVVGGIGLGMVSIALVTVDLPVGYKLAAVAMAGLVFVGLQALRARLIVRTCKQCVWKMDWEACPGFGSLSSQ